MKNSNDTSWNRTSDLLICSAAPYPPSHRGLKGCVDNRSCLILYCAKRRDELLRSTETFHYRTSYRCQSSSHVSTKHSVTTVTVLVVRRNSLWAQRHSWLPAKKYYSFYAFCSLFLSHSPCCLLYSVSFFIDLNISSLLLSVCILFFVVEFSTK